MLKLTEDKSLHCDFCNDNTFQMNKYTLTTKNGGYFCLCEKCLEKFEIFLNKESEKRKLNDSEKNYKKY